MADLRSGRLRILSKQADCGDDHAGCAVSALEPELLPEPLLHGVKRVLRANTLDGGDVCLMGLYGEHQARFGDASVDDHRARPAVAGLTPEVGPGQTELITQEMSEKRSIIGLGLDGFTVDCQ